MFKIVETIERGCKQLTIVPGNWESSGQLAWPKFRTDKLIKVADSMPEDSWFRMHCKLKRNHLLNYEIAEEELERMLEQDETEQEDIDAAVERRNRPRVSLPRKVTAVHSEDFNNLANVCLIAEQPSQKAKIISEEVISISQQAPQTGTNLQTTNFFENNTADNDVFVLSEDFSAGLVNNDFSETFKSSEKLGEKLDTIIENQTKIIENQNVIVQQLQTYNASNDNQIVINQLAKFEAILDTFGNNMTQNISSSNCTQKEKEYVDVIEQIESLEGLERLEGSLREKKTMDDLVERLSYVCGQKGNGNGINNCYILVDRMFARKFMTLCSWAGGARDKTEKIPFKIHKNVINLFFRVIHLSDKDFTLKDCEEFIKNVIRNSTRRNQSNMGRNSAMKRPKNLSYKKEEGLGNTKQNENPEKLSEVEEGDNRDQDEDENDADFEDDDA